MSHGLRFTSRARREARAVREWYEQQRPGLGRRFAEAMEVVATRLTESPEIYQVVHRDLRRAATDHFPFSVFHRVEGEAVTVLAVLHMHRDPSTWRGL